MNKTTGTRDLDRLVEGTHHDPHSVLGGHERPGGGAVIRIRRPEANGVSIMVGGTTHEGRHLATSAA